MPQGLSQEFLKMLQGDRRLARRRSTAGIVAIAALAAPAWMLLGGWGLAWAGAGGLTGVLAGMTVGIGGVRRYRASVSDHWSAWMRLSVPCATTEELHRKVEGRPRRRPPILAAAALVATWGALIAALVVSLLGTVPAWATAAAIGSSALAAGALVGSSMTRGRWFGSFSRALSEMVRDGELSVWGIR